MADTRFGNFQQLAQGKKPMTAKEAWIMLNELGLLAQEFVPGATSVRKLLEGKPIEALYDLQDWIPGNAAWQNFINGRDQDWVRNGLDAMAIANPLTKGVSKVMRAVEKVPKGGKGGFISLTKPTGQNKLNDVIEASNAAGQTITPAIEKEIRDHIGLFNQMKRNPSRSLQKQISNHYNRITPEAKQVIDGYLGQKLGGLKKPEGFESWPANERKKFLEDQFYTDLYMSPEEGLKKSKLAKDENYGGHYDYGTIYSDVLTTDDYMKALMDKEAEEKAAAQAAAQAPITMTEVQDLSTGILPGQSSTPKGGARQTYDHSKQFMDTELKQVPGIDRTGMSYGYDTDAFYDIYKAWRDSKPDVHTKNVSEHLGYDVAGTQSLRNLSREAREGKNRSKSSVRQTDPYYNAGIVGDENKRLWDKIKLFRESGKSDAEIRSILQKDLDKYQGNVERLKARMPSKAPNKSKIDYEGANTLVLKATPSEEARALKALGIDTPEYDELERLGNFYRVFFPY